MNEDKKLIYLLIALIICLSMILLIKIKTTPKYNPEVYKEVYDEYENIFGNEDDEHKVDESVTQNIIENNVITEENNTYTTFAGKTPNNIKQGNVIGKIIIPKIDIRYPILKETTEEYLKIAPTKYCGPEVNEIRKFSYSWT